MPSFLSKIKGAFSSSSPSPSRKSKPQTDLSYVPQLYNIKEKELSKLHLASWKGDLDKVIELCRPDKINMVDKDGRAPIHLAIFANHIEVVDHLINEGARFNLLDRESRSVLIIASIIGDPRMMDLLLKKNEHRNLVNIPDQTGLNPLLYSIKNENLQMLQLLLKNKDLNIDYQDKDKNTGLHYAVIQRKFELIDLLIDNGADVDVKNADGRTPLMLASQNGDEELIDYLLDYGADKNLKDNLGNTAVNLAIKSGNQKCADLFKDHRPVKANINKKLSTLDNDSESTEKHGSITDNKKKFENIFNARSKSIDKENDEDLSKNKSLKYRTKSQDAESDTSKLVTEEKLGFSNKADSWEDNSDEEEDSDDANEGNMSNLKKIIQEGDSKKFDSIFGPADLTNSKEIDSNIEININEDKLLSENNWDFKTNNDNAYNRNESSEFNVLTSFFPGSSKKTNDSSPSSSLSSNWIIYVYTSNLKKAGTDARVYIQIFGTKSNSTQFFLEDKNVKDLFETGKCDKFNKYLPDIGKPVKIKIGHNNKGLFAGWHLDKVVLENNLTNEKFTFPYGRWLAKDELDGKIELELNLEQKQIQKQKSREQSISSWNSTEEDDSLALSPNKFSSLKQTNNQILKQIDEEKHNESNLSKLNKSMRAETHGPPEISDFEESSIEDEPVVKNLNSTKKSDQLSVNLTNVTQNPIFDNNGSAISFLVKNSLPKQNSTQSSSPSIKLSNEKKTSALSDLWKNDKHNPNNLIKQKSINFINSSDDDDENSENVQNQSKTSIKKFDSSYISNDEANSSIKFLIENNLVPEPAKNQTIKKLINLETQQQKEPVKGLKELFEEEKSKKRNQLKSDQDSIDVLLQEFESPRPKQINETIKQLVPNINTNKMDSDSIDPFDYPKSESFDDLEKQFLDITKPSVEPQNPIKILAESIPPPGFRNDTNANSFVLHESKNEPGLKDLIKNEINNNKNKRINSDSVDSLASPKNSHRNSVVGNLIITSPRHKKISFDDSDDEQKSTGGVIDKGIGAFMSNFKDSPLSSPTKHRSTFMDLMPEIIASSSKPTEHDANELLKTLKDKNEQLEKSKIELEAQLKETEIQKKNFEIGFNNLDRLLAEKEKLINQMNAEKLKQDLTVNNSIDLKALKKEINDLKEEKIALENKLSVLQTTSALAAAAVNNKKDATGPNSLRSSLEFNTNAENESYKMKINLLEEQIEDLNKERKILSDLKEDLILKLDKAESDIKNHNEALQIVTLQFNVEKKALNEEIIKYKKDLNELNELKKVFEKDVDDLKKQINEKNLVYEKLKIELSNMEKQFVRERDDNEKLKKNYELEIGSLKEQQIKLMEKLAITEAKLISNENTAKLTNNQIDDRQKQIGDLKEQLIKSQTEFSLQLNLFKKEKEEKESLLNKVEQMELTIKKNMEEIAELKIKSIPPQYPDSNKSTPQSSPNRDTNKIETENKKLLNDVKNLTEKLNKTELELEKIKLEQEKKIFELQHQHQMQLKNQFENLNSNISKNSNSDNEKIQSEIQKLRQDFNTIMNKYSNLEVSNQELNESLLSIKNQTITPNNNRNDFLIRKDPVDVTGLITEVPLKTLTTLNSYLIQNLISKEDKNDLNASFTKSVVNFDSNKNGLINEMSHSHSHSFNCPKCNKLGNRSSYADMLKYELSKRIEVQVAKELSLSEGFNKFKTNTDNFDSLYNTMNTNTRYSNSFYHSNNSDLMNSLRAKFLI